MDYMKDNNYITVLNRGWQSPNGLLRAQCCLRESSLTAMWGTWKLRDMDGQETLDARVAKNRTDLVETIRLGGCAAEGSRQSEEQTVRACKQLRSTLLLDQ